MMTREERAEFNEALFALGFAVGLLIRLREALGESGKRFDEDVQFARDIVRKLRGEETET